MSERSRKNITEYIRARYAVLVIESFEEERVLSELNSVANDIHHELYVWNSTEGIKYNGKVADSKTADLRAAIDFCESKAKDANSKSLFVFCDAHSFLNDRANAVYRRRLKDFAISIRNKGYNCNCVIISPNFEISNDLQKEITLLDFPLPTKDEVRDVIRNFIDPYRNVSGVNINVDDNLLERYVDASLGLTELEIENCLSRSLVNDRRLDESDLKTIINEKKQIIRKTGILEFVDTNLNLNDVGGLQTLKKWLDLRSHCFDDKAKEFGVQPPKGVLLTGVPGCGKSLTAKCVASAWNMPLLRLDMGKIFQGLVGSSESNIRLALKTAEAVAPSILWIDEIEKGLSGSSGNGGDGGTSTRVFGTLLTWMQEKKSPVFVFATANNINGLPPELLRKGRFDEIFFVDFPSWEERKKILEIHISKLKRDLSKFDLDKLATLSGEKTFGKDVVLAGAEIEAWVGDSLIEAFSRRVGGDAQADMEMADFESTIKRIVPMGQMRKDEFIRLRKWANENAVSASISATEESSADSLGSGGNDSKEQFMAGRKIDF
ncbi:MAG: AAA family ATPase [Prevotella sp.]|nr:AAA family ATPase [Prevotella sp.]